MEEKPPSIARTTAVPPTVPKSSAASERGKLRSRLLPKNGVVSRNNGVTSFRSRNESSGLKTDGIQKGEVAFDLDDHDDKTVKKGIIKIGDTKSILKGSLVGGVDRSVGGIERSLSLAPGTIAVAKEHPTKGSGFRDLQAINERESLSAVFSDLGGVKSIIDDLSSGVLDFCYVEVSQTNPYQVRVIKKPMKKIEEGGKYMTLSKNGVVRSWEGETECQSFHDFVLEGQLYNKMRKLTFFYDFHRLKSFTLWRRAIQRQKFFRSSEFLAKNLLAIDPIFGPMHQRLMLKCESIRSRPLVSIQPGEVYELDRFLSSQRIFQEIAVRENTQGLSELTEFFALESRRALPAWLYPNRNQELIASDERTWKDKMSVGQSRRELDDRDTLTDAFRRSGDDALSFSDKAVIRAYCRKFGQLVRFADYVIRDALYDAVEQALQTTLDAFQATRDCHEKGQPGQGAFAVSLTVQPPDSLTGGPVSPRGRGVELAQQEAMIKSLLESPLTKCHLELRPSPLEMVEGVASFLEGTIKRGIYTVSLFRASLLQDMLYPVFNEQGQEDICMLESRLLPTQSNDGNSVWRLREQCETLVVHDMDQAASALAKYEPFCRKLNHNFRFFRGLSVDYLCSIKPSEIDGEISRLVKEQSVIEGLLKSEFRGLVVLSLVEVKSRPAQMVTICRQTLGRLVPEAFLVQADDTIERAYEFKKGIVTIIHDTVRSSLLCLFLYVCVCVLFFLLNPAISEPNCRY